MWRRPAHEQTAKLNRGTPGSDDELLAGLRAGSDAAFVNLYNEQAPAIYNFCLRILESPEDAQDVTQEVFIKAHRQLPGCDAAFRIRPWLYRVAVNASNDLLRKRKTVGDVSPLPEELGAAGPDAFEQAELSAVLEQTLAGLSVRQRTVVLLKDVHGLSHSEIAGILGVSRGATETLLFRAHHAFRRAYTALMESEPRRACTVARQAVVDSVGRGGLSAAERRRIAAHAKDCPECRRTVAAWGFGAFGLEALLHAAPLPAALATPPFAAALGVGVGGAAGAAGAGATGGAAAGAAASGAAAGAAASGAAAGGSAAAAALSAGAMFKAAIVGVAAATLVVGGGATVHRYETANLQPATHMTAGGHSVARKADAHAATPADRRVGGSAMAQRHGQGRALAGARKPNAADSAGQARGQHPSRSKGAGARASVVRSAGASKRHVAAMSHQAQPKPVAGRKPAVVQQHARGKTRTPKPRAADSRR